MLSIKSQQNSEKDSQQAGSAGKRDLKSGIKQIARCVLAHVLGKGCLLELLKLIQRGKIMAAHGAKADGFQSGDGRDSVQAIQHGAAQHQPLQAVDSGKGAQRSDPRLARIDFFQ